MTETGLLELQNLFTTLHFHASLFSDLHQINISTCKHANNEPSVSSTLFLNENENIKNYYFPLTIYFRKSCVMIEPDKTKPGLKSHALFQGYHIFLTLLIFVLFCFFILFYDSPLTLKAVCC